LGNDVSHPRRRTQTTGRRTSIRDVAAAVGVSSTTVSHVLNDVEGARVADETRVRVRQVAERLRYRPSRAARELRLRRTHTLGMLSDEIATTPYAGLIILGAQETALRLGWTLLLLNTGGDPSLERRDVELLVEHEVEGALYATMYHRRVELPDGLEALPTVLLDARADDRTIPAVVPDELAGARTAVDELLNAGHERIGFAQNHDDIPATHGRLEGYRRALEAVGAALDSTLVVTAGSDAAGGYAAVQRLLALREPPSSVFCFNDRMAMGAYRAAAERGLRIPHDLSIVGFDDQRVISEGLFPALTTVALPHYEMGRWAVETLVALVETGSPGGSAPPYPVLVECPVVRRDSVARPSRRL
jgi:LacI family transcriptional regulator